MTQSGFNPGLNKSCQRSNHDELKNLFKIQVRFFCREGFSRKQIPLKNTLGIFSISFYNLALSLIPFSLSLSLSISLYPTPSLSNPFLILQTLSMALSLSHSHLLFSTPFLSSFSLNLPSSFSSLFLSHVLFPILALSQNLSHFLVNSFFTLSSFALVLFNFTHSTQNIRRIKLLLKFSIKYLKSFFQIYLSGPYAVFFANRAHSTEKYSAIEFKEYYSRECEYCPNVPVWLG